MARDQRARGGHADEDRTGPLANRGARLLAQRGVRLVADHDRVGARDLAGVAHEPLVGLDRHGALGGVLALQQRSADALGVAAVAQLADELVDEVAPVREDQHAAGLRGLDEAERGDGLAGAGRVLEPEALGRVRVLGLIGQRLVLLALLRPVPRLLVGLGLGAPRSSSSLVLVDTPRRPRPRPRRPRRPPRAPRAGPGRGLVLVVSSSSSSSALWSSSSSSSPSAPAARAHRPRARARGASSGPRISAEASSSGEAEAAARPLPFGARRLRRGQQRRQRARQRVDLVRREHGAVGELRLVLGEQPLQAEQQREFAAPGCRGVFRLRVGLQLGQRQVERAAARRAGRQRDAGSSPSCRNRSRTSFSAREISAELGMGAAARATEVDSAMTGSGLRDGAAAEVASARLDDRRRLDAVCRMLTATRL